MTEPNAIDSLDQLYQEIIIDHHKDPRNYGEIKNAQIHTEGFNPLCGDHVVLDINLTDDATQVKECRFHGAGCSICMASASMMTEEIEGKSVAEIQAQIQDFRDLLQGKACPASIQGDLVSLGGVRRFPVRIKCALLPWTTLKDALEKKEPA
jgi:nitrogen fixation NifU-like protein